MVQRVAVAGSSGLIGGALCRRLVERGDQVLRLVRGPARSSDELRWDPSAGVLPNGALDDVDAVVDLAGPGVGDRRWTPARKQFIEDARVSATRTLAFAIASQLERSGRRLRLVNASAVGYYGDRGDEVLTESSAPGSDFLAGVVQRWEAATRPAVDAGAPVAVIRTGLVMAHGGGAFVPLLRLSRLGLGGRLGSGKQWWPWITLEDEVRAILYLVDHPDITGPVNLAAPEAARQKDISGAICRRLHRPSVLPAPGPALRLVVGEFAEAIMASQRMAPEVLIRHGFGFSHGNLDSAVRWLLAA